MTIMYDGAGTKRSPRFNVRRILRRLGRRLLKFVFEVPDGSMRVL